MSAWVGAVCRLFVRTGVILLGTAILSWPAFVNGQPFLLSDSTTYIRGADAAIYKLTGKPSDWSDRYIAKYRAGDVGAQTHDKVAEPSDAPVTLSGRSIYYGIFISLPDRVSGLWLAAAIQAFLAATSLFLTLARFRSKDVTVEFLLLAGILSSVSSLAYFSAYLMPDIFTGLGLLAAAHLITRSPPLSHPVKAYWFGLLCTSALFHTANVLIVFAALAGICVMHYRKRVASGSGILLVTASLIVALCGEAAFYAGVDHLTGNPPVRPPFLTARMIADGPGRDYLDGTCPGSGFVLCRHLGSLSGSSDDFLWSEHPYNGVFSTVPNSERRQIAAEQTRFLFDLVRDRPLQVLRSSVLTIADQALMWGLPEFNLAPKQRNELAAKLPPRVLRQQSQTRAFEGAMPVRFAQVLTLPSVLLSLWVILWGFIRGELNKSTRAFAAVLLIGIVADIAICGAISTPHDRYIMRLAWLVPLAAFATQTVPGIRLLSRLRSWRSRANFLGYR